MDDQLLWLGLTLAAGFLPGLLLMRIGLPMGGIIGAMIGTAILNVLTEHAVFPDGIYTALILLAGAMIGSRIGREELRSFRQLMLGILIVIAVMLIFNLVLGGLIYALSNLDAATALFAVMPGGGTEMAIVSGELGANPAQVGIMQIIRGILFLMIVPPLFSSIIQAVERRGNCRYPTRAHLPKTQKIVKGSDTDWKKESFHYGIKDLILLAGLFISAGLGGVALSALNVPAGLLVGSVLAGATYSILCGKAVYPVKFLPVQQILSGACLGMSVTKQTVSGFGELLLPVVIMLLGIILFSLLSGYLLCRIAKMDLITSFLAASPCGVAELALVSEELGAETSKVAIIQTARFIAVVSTFPVLLGLIVKLL